MKKRIFLIVLDSFGIGNAPDAADFGDEGANTLKSIAASPEFNAETMASLGLFNIDGVEVGIPSYRPRGAYGRLFETSRGKDTTIGHWEIAGILSNEPLPTYPDGFPDGVIAEFERATGRKVICNKPYSGTDVIYDYGREHEESGALIVYTSADSVFQIAAHEDTVPTELLYEYCRAARKILCGKHAVGRVIARPFTGKWPNYTRTVDRHDFSLTPPAKTMLDLIKNAGKDVISVGKINDIFDGQGITESHPITSNSDGMAKTSAMLERDFDGLCFVNLVDFDMKYGHRNDVDGYAAAIAEFDGWLGGFLPGMKKDDLLIITADHGCDPGDFSTDHTREGVPLLVYQKGIEPCNLGTRQGFCDIAATVCDLLGVDSSEIEGTGFAERIKKMKINREELYNEALEARKNSYCPYSGYAVGAALLSADGRVFHGANIENAAFSPTICAERAAFAFAVSVGVRDFVAIAVCGGKKGEEPDPACTPCGVCRQVMAEFCKGDFEVILNGRTLTLAELLPHSFKM